MANKPILVIAGPGAGKTYGMVNEIEKSRDGLIRKVQVKYRNYNENNHLIMPIVNISPCSFSI